MGFSLDQSESKFFEQARISLTNAQTNTEVKNALAEYNYGDEKINEGWQIFNAAKTAWEMNQSEDTETKMASNAYHNAYGALELKYKRHRDLSRILCKKDPEILILLGLKGKLPTVYNEFFDRVKLFYNQISSNTQVQEKLAAIKITPEVASECLTELEALLELRAKFDMEMGESQAATVSKNTAILELSEWMDDFEGMAKIALYDQPEILEVLGMDV